MPVDAVSVTGFPVELSPAAIDRELASMWKQMGDSDDTEAGVTRIALGNLIWLGSSRHVKRTRRVFNELIAHYPCRLFILEVTSETASDEITAFINARCFLPQDLRNEICCEEIHLRFGTKSLPHIAAAVRSLLLPDVPTCFWYYSAQPDIYDTILPAFESMADRMITEVSWMDEPARGLRQLAQSRAATSLAWYRYAPIREQIAAIFDDSTCASMVNRIASLRFTWSGNGDSNKRVVHTSLLAGWMASRLGWKATDRDSWPYEYDYCGRTIHVEAVRDASSGDEPPRLKAMEILFTSGDRFALNWIDDNAQMERVLEGPSIPCSGKPRFVSARVLNDAEALGEALNTRGDRKFFIESAQLAWPLVRAAQRNRVQL